MRMAMRVEADSGFVLQCQVHLICAGRRHDIVGSESSVVGNNHPFRIACLYVDRNPIKSFSVLAKNVGFDAILDDGVDGQHDSVVKLFNGNSDHNTLPRFVSPANESSPLLRLVADKFIGKRDIKAKCARFGIDLVR